MRASARSGDELCRIAGHGCPYTLPIGGRALIEHALRLLRDAGVAEILVAADAPIAEVVADAIRNVSGAAVHLALQPDNDDDVTIRALRKVLGEGPLAVVEGDVLIPGGLELRRDTVYVSGGRPVAWTLDDLPAEQLAPTGATTVELEGAWSYDGTVDGALEGNTLALDAVKRGLLGVDLAAASVQGRVQIDPSAELDGAKLRGPAFIGAGARLIETYVGPYTSIGAGVTLEGVEIEHSIVLPGAEIRYPGRRLEASLVGEGAQIGRDYSLPSALRVRVGPGSEIQLS